MLLAITGPLSSVGLFSSYLRSGASEKMNKKIETCLFSRVPVLVWGPPGAGKTSSIRALALQLGRPVWTVIASYREPADFGGLPIVKKESLEIDKQKFTVVELAPPKYAVEAATSKEGGLIFFDEITCFPAGTKVTSYDNGALIAKPIEEIRYNDIVVSSPISSCRKNTNKVIATNCRTASNLVKINYVVPMGIGHPEEKRSLTCTADHMVWAISSAAHPMMPLTSYSSPRWKMAAELVPGDLLFEFTNMYENCYQRKVVSIEKLPGTQMVYDITVENDHCFFADKILVHNCTPPAVQAPLLRVVQELVVGELELPPSMVAVIAAANPPEMAAGGWDLSPPLANRFSHIQYQLKPDDWIESFPTYWMSPPKLQLWDKQLPEDKWMQNRVITSAFIRARPALLIQFPSSSSHQGGAWPSPRTWDNLSRLMTAADVNGLSKEDRAELVNGSVGPGAGAEFLSWTESLDLPDPEEVLANPESFKFPDRGDRQFAVLSSVVSVVAMKNTPERWQKAWKVMITASDRYKAPDIAAASARMLTKARPPRGASIPPEVDRCFRPLLEAAGLTVGK